MGNLNVDVFNPFPAKPFTLLMLFSSKSSLKEMLKRPQICILRTQLHFRMYQKLKSRSYSSIQCAYCIPCHTPLKTY